MILSRHLDPVGSTVFLLLAMLMPTSASGAEPSSASPSPGSGASLNRTGSRGDLDERVQAAVATC